MYYKPHFFAASEIFPPEVITEYGEDKCWEFLDHRLLITLDVLRLKLNRRIFINGYNPIRNKSYSYRGFRPNTYLPDELNCSPHRRGQAADFDVEGMTAEQVREWITLNATDLPYPLWVEMTNDGEDINWVHIDVRYSAVEDKIYLFNA